MECSVEKLQEYVFPIRDKILLLENQIRQAEEKINKVVSTSFPSDIDMKDLTRKAGKALKNLNFPSKQAIIRSIIEKVEGNTKELQVWGYIPINELNYVSFCSSHRNCRTT